jgi:hypothetical protein
MATRDQFRTTNTAQPFRPYSIKLADGRSFRVNHPELAARSVNGRELVVYDDEGIHLLEMLLVAEMGPAPAQSSPAEGNGP